MIRAVSKDFSWNASAHEFSFFFNDTATTEIYTLSLHDALPISHHPRVTPGQLERHDHGALLIHGHDRRGDRKSTRLNSSHVRISYAVFCLKKKNIQTTDAPELCRWQTQRHAAAQTLVARRVSDY